MHSVFDGWDGAFQPGQTTPRSATNDSAPGVFGPYHPGEYGLSDGDGKVHINTVGEFCP